MSEEVVPPEQAQLARMTWILKQGSEACGLTLSVPGMQRLALSMHKVMLDNRMFFETQQHVEDKLAEMERT